jgi:hypothetical protein
MISDGQFYSVVLSMWQVKRIKLFLDLHNYTMQTKSKQEFDCSVKWKKIKSLHVSEKNNISPCDSPA